MNTLKKEYMTIDGRMVEINGEKNLLELIRKAGIQMPTLCYHSELSVYGSCRMCIVETDRSELEAACSTPPRTGMIIHTNTKRLRRYRKNILEMLLANHYRDCTACQNSGKCKLQDLASRFNIDRVRFDNTSPVPRVDDSSVCITRDASKCILCGDCVRMCSEVQSVGAIDFIYRGSKMVIGTAYNRPIADSPCVGCGQCGAVCPTGAIIVRDDTEKVLDALEDSDTVVTAQIAPAVRVALGQELHVRDGENVMVKIIAALHTIGFDRVYDTSTGADLTVIEESEELEKHLDCGSGMPLFTSCCPAWVQYCEKKYPELLPNVSTCRSPMQMLASVVKYKEKEKKINVKQFHVAVMPCTAKKFEALRKEFSVCGVPNVDAVISTQELVRIIRESGVLFDRLEPEAVDMPFGTSSGSGVIFGLTGGVTEAVLRRISDDKSRNGLYSITFSGIRGNEGIKEASVPYKDGELHIAVVSGLGNTGKLIEEIKSGTKKYDFVEVMACPGGCVNGGGQPFASHSIKNERVKGLYAADNNSNIRCSDENPFIDAFYNDIKAQKHELLHVDYKNINLMREL